MRASANAESSWPRTWSNTCAVAAPVWSAWKVRTAASWPSAAAPVASFTPSAASTSSSDILPVVAKARSAGGTSPRGAGTRRMLA